MTAPAMHGTQRGRVIRPAFVTRTMLLQAPDTLFAFGDNMQRRGLGGQAREMRGAANAIGIPTKWAPHTGPGAFFTDADWDRSDVRDAITGGFDIIAAALDRGQTIAIPADGIGTGRAELPARAPRIAAYITDRVAALEASRR